MALLRWLNPGDQSDHVEIAPFTPDAALRLRTSLFERFSPTDIAARVLEHPELAWTVPGQSYFALGGLWRRRADVGEVLEVSRGPYRHELLARLTRSFDEAGVALVVLDFEESGNDAEFYSNEGFRPIERIVEYERRGSWVGDHPGRISVRPFEPSQADAVLEMERQSFPWLWWNSRAELEHYYRLPEVEMYLSFDGDLAVGYAGITVRGGAGHIDRLAVRSSHQRQGHGSALLIHVLHRLGNHGVRRVTLSTQADNYRSQSLYERYGFHRSRWAYDIRGLWLREPPEADQ
jgi:GNAT superfamily N-acetyltransferase